MIGSALKHLASQYGMTINSNKAYGYMLGSFVTLTENYLARRMSIYVGSVNVQLPEGEELSPAAKCSAIIADMVTKASGEENLYGLLRNRFIPALVLNHSGSVVTLNFRRDEAGLNGMQRFIAELLPRITPLTAPLQCCHCSGHTGGQGYPVQIAADAVVPMHPLCQQEAAKAFAASNHTLREIIGAAFGALIGAAGWVLLFRTGILTAISSLLILLLSLGGYCILRGKTGWTQAIVIAVCTLTGILISDAARYIWQLHEEYQAFGSVVSNMMRESVYMRVALKQLLADASLLGPFALDLLFGLVYSLIHAVYAMGGYKSCAEASAPKNLPGQA